MASGGRGGGPWVAPVAAAVPDTIGAEQLYAELDERIHVWLVRAESPLPEWWVARNEPLLSASERVRHRRYRRDHDRELFLVAHVAVRRILSRYAAVDPAAWGFDLNDHGRPEPVHRDAPPGLRTNLSHTAGMVALAVHNNTDCGVDVERVDRATDIGRVSSAVFAAEERDDVLALPAERQADRFFRLWTLKEAFLKATGRGLAVPLKDFSFSLGEGGPTDVSVRCAPTVEPHADAWAFSVRQLTEVHMLATACRAATPPRPVDLYDATEALGLV